MKFIWDAKYSVNIKSIDTQHQRFFEICNEIGYMVHQHQTDPASLSKVVKELTDYAEKHLSYEEKYFSELKFPGAEAHIAAHNLFREKIKQLTTAEEIADFARDWLSDHILAVDHKYSQFFLAHDVK